MLHGYAEAARFRADIVHDHTLVGPLCAAHRSDLRVVTTNHGPFDGELEALYRAVAGRVPAPSPSPTTRRHGPATYRFARSSTLGLVMADYPVGDGKAGHAVFLGRMHPSRKGRHRACQIARKAGVPLLDRRQDAEPADDAYFGAMRVQPLLGGGIEYVGELDAAAKVELLGGARCLLNPITWHEPFGMVMIEALACGTPVVARSMGAAPEIVADGVTGALAGGDDDLARAVREATGFEPHRCRRDAVARFSDARMVGAHRELYDRVIGGASTPRRLRRGPDGSLSAAAGLKAVTRRSI